MDERDRTVPQWINPQPENAAEARRENTRGRRLYAVTLDPDSGEFEIGDVSVFSNLSEVVEDAIFAGCASAMDIAVFRAERYQIPDLDIEQMFRDHLEQHDVNSDYRSDMVREYAAQITHAQSHMSSAIEQMNQRGVWTTNLTLKITDADVQRVFDEALTVTKE